MAKKRCVTCLKEQEDSEFHKGYDNCYRCIGRLYHDRVLVKRTIDDFDDYDDIEASVEEEAETAPEAPQTAPSEPSPRHKSHRWNAAGDLRCNRCNKYKSTDEYHKARNTKIGYAQWCKQCFKDARAGK